MEQEKDSSASTLAFRTASSVEPISAEASPYALAIASCWDSMMFVQ
jgi:hypothetical protein